MRSSPCFLSKTPVQLFLFIWRPFVTNLNVSSISIQIVQGLLITKLLFSLQNCAMSFSFYSHAVSKCILSLEAFVWDLLLFRHCSKCIFKFDFHTCYTSNVHFCITIFRNMDFSLIFKLLTTLSVTGTVFGCSCVRSHPQQKFCDSVYGKLSKYYIDLILYYTTALLLE